MDRNELGQRLRGARKAAGVSQEALSGRTGVAVSTIIRIEQGKATPTLATLGKLAGALGIETKALAFGDEKGEETT